MKALEELIHLLAATADDRWLPSHPSARPWASPEDRAHDAAWPNDPTADTAIDPARLALAEAWRAAMDHVHYLCAVPREIRYLAIDASEPIIVDHILALRAAHDRWAGRAQRSAVFSVTLVTF